jgi:hypothetical protein
MLEEMKRLGEKGFPSNFEPRTHSARKLHADRRGKIRNLRPRSSWTHTRQKRLGRSVDNARLDCRDRAQHQAALVSVSAREEKRTCVGILDRNPNVIILIFHFINGRFRLVKNVFAAFVGRRPRRWGDISHLKPFRKK